MKKSAEIACAISLSLLLVPSLPATPGFAEEEEPSGSLTLDLLNCLVESPLTAFLCLGREHSPLSLLDNDAISLAFSSVNQFGDHTFVFDNVDDIRNFTASALFSEALGGNVDPEDATGLENLRGIAHGTFRAATFNTVSITTAGFPVLDLTYKRAELDEIKMSNFFDPTAFNDVEVKEYGVGLRYGRLSSEQPYSLYAAYRFGAHTGLADFFPDKEENVDEYQINGIYGFNFDETAPTPRTTVTLTYIRQKIDSGFDHTRDIYVGKAKHFAGELRNFELFAGARYDVETFADIDWTRTDYYAGGVWHGMARLDDELPLPLHLLDFGVQATRFASEKSNNPNEDNAQVRSDVFLRLRSEDWRYAITVPVSYDVAVDNLDAFENYKIGLDVSTRQIMSVLGVGSEVLLSLRYDRAEFFNIDRSENLFLGTVAFGFSE